MAEPGSTIDTVGADHFIKLQGVKKMDESDGDNGVPPDFAYVGQSGSTAAGWEGSAAISPGVYDELTVHANVDGGATSGVVEQAIDLTIICYDYGDLPNTYGITTNSENGARHSIGNLYLGASVDSENDGQPNASALGDDNNGDDEDGVVLTPGVPWTNDDGGSLNVTVTGGPGCLSGWMDWNNDGDFEDEGEFIIQNLPLAAGQHQVTFDIPDGIDLEGNFFARFRLYAPGEDGTCSGASLTGAATNGEVEDYVFDPATPTAVTITRLTARGNTGLLPLALAAGGLTLLAALAVTFRRAR
jgi:hypothetical protein